MGSTNSMIKSYDYNRQSVRYDDDDGDGQFTLFVMSLYNFFLVSVNVFDRRREKKNCESDFSNKNV